MGLLSAFPPSPLTHADTVRIRAREEVEAFTTVGTTTIRSLRTRQRERGTRAVALVDGIVCGFEFDGSSWSEQRLQCDADQRDHLEATLDWM